MKLSALAIGTPALAFLLACSFAAPETRACSVMEGWPPPPAELAAQTDLVFAGTVTGIIQDKSVFGDYRITFAVNEALKGDVGDTVTLRVPGSSAACGYDDGYGTFEKGTAWIIYGSDDGDAAYRTNGITGNTKYADAAAAVTALRAIRAAMDGSVTPAPQEDLTVGSRGGSVTWLQQALIAENAGDKARALASVGATGYFGAYTRAALAEYQAAKGIAPASGYYGAKTRAIMTNDVAPRARLFTGVISAVKTDCFFDAVCSVTVDGNEVILATGERLGGPRTTGSLKGVESIGDLEGKIGSEARVYAAVTNEGGADYTLYGDENFYVQVLGPLPEDGPVTITGRSVCLPPKDPTVPSILLCMLGLEGDDGRYYALSDEDGNSGMLNNADVEDGFVVKGTFRAEPSTNSFQSDGVIEVSSFKPR